MLPTIPFGSHTISRLICGANPFGGGSHLSEFVNIEMRQYFTDDQVLKTLRRCEEVGINCWQSSGGDVARYRRYVAEGGELKYISLGLDQPEYSTPLSELAEAGCIAVAHHGEFTDSMFKEGRLSEVAEYLKKVRDSGMMVGVSTHMPDVVDAIESAGWDVDFYMTCVYERHRSREQLAELLGDVPIPLSEVYLEGDPPRMFKAMRSTEKPCLAFKILAAGRLSDRPEWVEEAFRATFEAIKPNDAVIVGIYDKFTDQPAECAELVKRYG